MSTVEEHVTMQLEILIITGKKQKISGWLILPGSTPADTNFHPYIRMISFTYTVGNLCAL
jgi:hypothetical protein